MKQKRVQEETVLLDDEQTKVKNEWLWSSAKVRKIRTKYKIDTDAYKLKSYEVNMVVKVIFSTMEKQSTTSKSFKMGTKLTSNWSDVAS